VVRISGVAVVLIAIATTAAAVPVPLIRLSDLIEQSDVIVTGTVTAVYDDGPALIDRFGATMTGRMKLADISIDAVVKGTVGGNVRVRFTAPDEFIGYESVGANSFRMFFFRKNGDEYVPASPYLKDVSKPRAAGFIGGRHSISTAHVAQFVEPVEEHSIGSLVFSS